MPKRKGDRINVSWNARQRVWRRSLRETSLYAILGNRIFRSGLWKVDKRSLAGGLALGLFIAFTPTIPFQMLLVAAGAIVFKVNLPVALAACWVTNPLTAVPIYMAAWRLGRFVIGEEGPIREFFDMFLAKSGSRRFIRESLYLWTGSVVFAAASAGVGAGLVCFGWNVKERVRRHYRESGGPSPVKNITKILVPIGLLIAGAVLHKLGWIDVDRLSQAIAARADLWWLPGALIGMMVVMYALALPGSVIMLVIGIVYQPLFATLLVTLGGVAGSWLAYILSRRVYPDRLASHGTAALVGALRRRGSFFMLCALRVLPGFPHAVISYSAGALNIGKCAFLGSCLLGFSLKGFVYTSAIYRTTHLEPDSSIWTPQMLWPFFAMLLLVIAGIVTEHWRWARARTGQVQKEHQNAEKL